jgi:hypothetical protein
VAKNGKKWQKMNNFQKKSAIFTIFLNLHALGYPKSVTGFFCEHFWVNKSLSMMWVVCKLQIFLQGFAISGEEEEKPHIYAACVQFQYESRTIEVI